MKRALWLLILVSGAFAQAPSAFYVAAWGISDFNPSAGTEILDVRLKGGDTLVRDILIENVDAYCRIPMVKLAEARLKATTPVELVAVNNPCGVQPGIVRDAVRQFQRIRGSLKTASIAIVAQCGSNEVRLRLPTEQELEMTGMRRRLPKIAALWSLAAQVQVRAFGDSNVFSEEKSLEQQKAGRAAVPELLAGRFNRGFLDGRMPNDLSMYRGPIESRGYAVTLVNAGSYQFTNYVAPVTANHIRGKVVLLLTISPDTGEVQDVVTLSGSPILETTAVQAAKKWRFVPGSTSSEPIAAVLDFASGCPDGY